MTTLENIVLQGEIFEMPAYNGKNLICAVSNLPKFFRESNNASFLLDFLANDQINFTINRNHIRFSFNNVTYFNDIPIGENISIEPADNGIIYKAMSPETCTYNNVTYNYQVELNITCDPVEDDKKMSTNLYIVNGCVIKGIASTSEVCGHDNFIYPLFYDISCAETTLSKNDIIDQYDAKFRSFDFDYF